MRGARILPLLALCVLAPARGDEPGAAATPVQREGAAAATRAAVAGMMRDASVPGVSVAVALRGEVVYAEGFGFADLEQRVPMTPRTKLGIGSVSKALTTALLARLVEAGTLDLDEPIERWLPAFPHAGRGISLRLVAGHLSGLDDSFNARARNGTVHYDTTEDALREIFREPLLFPPGTRHHYTTGPYTLLAGVAEKATGRPFLELVRRHVLEPLSLDDTVPNDRRAIVPERTAFYVLDAATGRSVNAPWFDPSYKWAGAGYLSTATDLARFGAALLRPGFLGDRTRGELFRPLRTSAGEETGYALGWQVTTDAKGRRIIQQPGGGEGVAGILVLHPEDDLVVAILSNQTGAPVGGRTAEAIAEAFLER